MTGWTLHERVISYSQCCSLYRCDWWPASMIAANGRSTARPRVRLLGDRRHVCFENEFIRFRSSHRLPNCFSAHQSSEAPRFKRPSTPVSTDSEEGYPEDPGEERQPEQESSPGDDTQTSMLDEGLGTPYMPQYLLR